MGSNNSDIRTQIKFLRTLCSYNDSITNEESFLYILIIKNCIPKQGMYNFHVKFIIIGTEIFCNFTIFTNTLYLLHYYKNIFPFLNRISFSVPPWPTEQIIDSQ